MTYYWIKSIAWHHIIINIWWEYLKPYIYVQKKKTLIKQLYSQVYNDSEW